MFTRGLSRGLWSSAQGTSSAEEACFRLIRTLVTVSFENKLEFFAAIFFVLFALDCECEENQCLRPHPVSSECREGDHGKQR